MAKAQEYLSNTVSHARREPGWAYRHGLRTANLALWLRDRIFPGVSDMDDMLYTAALFHDCAKDDEADHGKAGAERARAYLEAIAGKDDLDTITHAILMHNKRGQPSTDLEKLLQDADIIDHFGTIEVWLNISYSVLGGEGPERSLAFYDTEWEPMIGELRSLFNFELSRAVFEERVRFNEEFTARFRIEATGGVAMPGTN